MCAHHDCCTTVRDSSCEGPLLSSRLRSPDGRRCRRDEGWQVYNYCTYYRTVKLRRSTWSYLYSYYNLYQDRQESLIKPGAQLWSTPPSNQKKEEASDEDQQAANSKLVRSLHVDFSHLVKSEQEFLQTLLTSYADIFALDSSELGTTEMVTQAVSALALQCAFNPVWLRSHYTSILQTELNSDSMHVYLIFIEIDPRHRCDGMYKWVGHYMDHWSNLKYYFHW